MEKEKIPRQQMIRNLSKGHLTLHLLNFGYALVLWVQMPIHYVSPIWIFNLILFGYILTRTTVDVFYYKLTGQGRIFVIPFIAFEIFMLTKIPFMY